MVNVMLVIRIVFTEQTIWFLPIHYIFFLCFIAQKMYVTRFTMSPPALAGSTILLLSSTIR